MNPELKSRWLSALRSGKYEQGRFSLKESKEGHTSFCCLGVALDLINSDNWFLAQTDPEFGPLSLYEWGQGDDCLAPSRIDFHLAERLGLSVEAAQKLATLNDHERLSFEQVAAYIEGIPNES